MSSRLLLHKGGQLLHASHLVDIYELSPGVSVPSQEAE